MRVVTFKLRFRLQRCSYVSGFTAKETYNTIQEALGDRKPPPRTLSSLLSTNYCTNHQLSIILVTEESKNVTSLAKVNK